MIRGAIFLGARHAAHHRWRSLTIIACIGIIVALPLVARSIAAAFETAMVARALDVPLVVGAKGSRFDLVLNVLYFRGVPAETTSMAEWQRVVDGGGCIAIPMNLRFRARGFPVVAAGLEYRELRGLRLESGSWPTLIGECVLGAEVAAELKLGAGGVLFSDQREMYNIAAPPSLALRVTGVIAATGTPDDRAVLTDIGTAWALEGLSHAHAPRAAVPDELVLDRTDRNIALSEALVNHNEIKPENARAFHVHASPDMLPLSGIIVVPSDARERTLIKARLNAGKQVQAVTPAEVITELMGHVVRVRALVDAVAALLGSATAALLGLVAALTAQLRARERRTLQRLGISRFTLVCMFVVEIALLAGSGCGLGVLVSAALAGAGIDPMKFL